MESATLGERITSKREALKWTKTRLGREAGIHAVLIGRYEKDEAVPKTDNLKKLARALGVSVEYLVEGEEYPLVDLPEAFVVAWQKADTAGKGVLLYLMEEMIEKYKKFIRGFNGHAPTISYATAEVGFGRGKPRQELMGNICLPGPAEAVAKISG